MALRLQGRMGRGQDSSWKRSKRGSPVRPRETVMPMNERMTESELAEAEKFSARDVSFAMRSGCTDYACYCHSILPRAVAEVRRLRKLIVECSEGIEVGFMCALPPHDVSGGQMWRDGQEARRKLHVEAEAIRAQAPGAPVIPPCDPRKL